MTYMKLVTYTSTEEAQTSDLCGAMRRLQRFSDDYMKQQEITYFHCLVNIVFSRFEV